MLNTEKLIMISILCVLLLHVLPAKGIYIKKKKSLEIYDENLNPQHKKLLLDYYEQQRTKTDGHTTDKTSLGFEEVRGSSIARSLERDFPTPKRYFYVPSMSFLGTYAKHNTFQYRFPRFSNTLTGLYKENICDTVYNSRTVKDDHSYKKEPTLKENILQTNNLHGGTVRKHLESQLQKKRNVEILKEIMKKRVKRELTGFKSRRTKRPLKLKVSNENAKSSEWMESRFDIPAEMVSELRRKVHRTPKNKQDMFENIARLQDYFDKYVSTEGPVRRNDGVFNPPFVHKIHSSVDVYGGKHFVSFC